MSDYQAKLKSNIWKLYAFQVLTSVAFFVPICVLFWQANGLSMTQIMVLQSLFSIVVVLLEIPTGYFSDIMGRKVSLTLAGIFLSAAVGMYIIGYNFYYFLIAEMLWAVGCSCISGTDSSMLYDTLIGLKKKNLFQKYWGKTYFLSLIATAITNLIGGFIGKYSLRWTFYAMLPFFLLLIPLALSMTEPLRKKLIIKQGYVHNVIHIIKSKILVNPKLIWLIIYSAIIYGFSAASLWLYQPYFSLTGLNIVYFGVVFAIFQMVAAISSKYAYKVESYLGKKYSLVLLLVLVSVSYFLMSNFIYLFSFSFAFLLQFIRGFQNVVITDYVNKLTTSDIRATVMSTKSMFSQLTYALIIPIIGWIVDVYSLVQALTVLCITSFIFGFIALVILHKKKVLS